MKHNVGLFVIFSIKFQLILLYIIMNIFISFIDFHAIIFRSIFKNIINIFPLPGDYSLIII